MKKPKQTGHILCIHLIRDEQNKKTRTDNSQADRTEDDPNSVAAQLIAIRMTFHKMNVKEDSVITRQTFQHIANVTSIPPQATKNHTVMVSVIMFSCGVFGNILALVALARSKKEQKQTIFYKLAASLVVTDLLGILATSPVVIATYENNFKVSMTEPLLLLLLYASVIIYKHSKVWQKNTGEKHSTIIKCPAHEFIPLFYVQVPIFHHSWKIFCYRNVR